MTIVDIGTDPANPKFVASLPLMTSIFGPPTNLAITPKGQLALVANSMEWVAEGPGWKPSPDNKLYVIDLSANPPRLIDTVTVGKQPSGLSINRAGTLYSDETNRDLKYATNASGSWVAQAVDSSVYGDRFNSIATDSNNNIHISYLDMTGHLKYATDASGSWVTDTVDDVQLMLEPSSEYTSIAISYDNVLISYVDVFGLKYATNALGSWVSETVDSSGGMGNSIAVDSSGKVHISYYGYFGGDLKYANSSHPLLGPFEIQTVDSAVYVLLYFSSIVNTSEATDSNNKVHISYYDWGNQDLKYATKNASGSWNIEIVDSEGEVGWYTSIAVDSNNKVHISYQDCS